MNKWQTILSFTYPHEAYMAKAYLESNGIDTIIRDELTAQVNNFYSNAIGGVKLQVRTDDMDNGIRILKEGGYLGSNEQPTEANVAIIKLERASNKAACPFCQSGNIARKRDPNVLVVLVYFLLGVIFPIFKAGYQCFDCGKEWKYEK